ncbi:MAG: Stp1/IreP family PP2C-type Ser/Thr phosphatase [Candidatus Riflebacteria bacterium]|nr:Stp1/IreP family PP2C-type Ser/Thr phosphatase [Candidatus Riflebacteria bacterium]
MEYKAYGKTDVGKVRTNNEDAFFVTDREGIFLVADGMGGHKAGEVASGMTRDIISSSLLATQGTQNLENSIREAFLLANTKVRDKASEDTEFQGMGCTCVSLMLREQNFFLAHVGDSRIYLFRRGEFKQMTRDHSYVEELFIRGLISEQEKIGHPYKNQITRYIGCSQKLEVDITSGPVWNGDCFLLCTDGLTEMVLQNRIKELFSNGDDPQSIGDKLIEEALTNGGKDNITAVVVQVTSKKTSFFKKILGW